MQHFHLSLLISLPHPTSSSHFLNLSEFIFRFLSDSIKVTSTSVHRSCQLWHQNKNNNSSNNWKRNPSKDYSCPDWVPSLRWNQSLLVQKWACFVCEVSNTLKVQINLILVYFVYLENFGSGKGASVVQFTWLCRESKKNQWWGGKAIVSESGRETIAVWAGWVGKLNSAMHSW